MQMGKGEERGTGEATRDKVCRMIEEGYLTSEIREELKISSATYWEIKKSYKRLWRCCRIKRRR